MIEETRFFFSRNYCCVYSSFRLSFAWNFLLNCNIRRWDTISCSAFHTLST